MSRRFKGATYSVLYFSFFFLTVYTYAMFIAVYAPPVIDKILTYSNGEWASILFLVGLIAPVVEASIYADRRKSEIWDKYNGEDNGGENND